MRSSFFPARNSLHIYNSRIPCSSFLVALSPSDALLLLLTRAATLFSLFLAHRTQHRKLRHSHKKLLSDLLSRAGWGDVWKQLRQCKESKVGRLVGTDRFGNRYYENKLEQFNRDR